MSAETTEAAKKRRFFHATICRPEASYIEGAVMEAKDIVVWIDHKNKLISGIRVATGVLYRFVSFEALFAYCQPLLENRYRMQ